MGTADTQPDQSSLAAGGAGGELSPAGAAPSPEINLAAPPAGNAGEYALQMLAQLQTQAAQIGSLWQQTQQRWTDLELRTAQLDVARARLDEDRLTVEAMIADLERRSSDLVANGQQLDARRAEVESHAAAERARELGFQQRDSSLIELQANVERERAELAAERDGLRARAESLEQAAAAAAAAVPAAPIDTGLSEAERHELADLRKQLVQREDALRVLADRLMRAEERSLQHQAEENQRQFAEAEALSRSDAARDGAPPVSSDEAFANALRRARLARYKQLLNTQSKKLLRARDGLAKRQAECDQVLSLRSQLAERAAALSARENALQLKSQRSTAAVIGVCAAAALAMVSGLAWTAAGKVAPSRYAATAILAASTPDREPAEGELDSWTQSYQELLTDPAVVQEAAQQFSRRAMTTLATPPAVKERIDQDLFVHSPEPGKFVIEWRGEGAERSVRELETYLAAALSVGEGRRHSRGDGALTTISQPPTHGAEPLDNLRVRYAAGFTGGGMLLATLAAAGGFVLIRRQERAITREVSSREAI
jgi:hypothetical protein